MKAVLPRRAGTLLSSALAIVLLAASDPSPPDAAIRQTRDIPFRTHFDSAYRDSYAAGVIRLRRDSAQLIVVERVILRRGSHGPTSISAQLWRAVSLDTGIDPRPGRAMALERYSRDISDTLRDTLRLDLPLPQHLPISDYMLAIILGERWGTSDSGVRGFRLIPAIADLRGVTRR